MKPPALAVGSVRIDAIKVAFTDGKCIGDVAHVLKDEIRRYGIDIYKVESEVENGRK